MSSDKYKIVEYKFSSLDQPLDESLWNMSVHPNDYDEIAAYKVCTDLFLIELAKFEEWVDVVRDLQLYKIENENEHEEGIIYWDEISIDKLNDVDFYKKIHDYVKKKWVETFKKIDWCYIYTNKMILI